MIDWAHTFRRDGSGLSHAKVSIYLAGTASPARVFDQLGTLNETAPQLYTDASGYVEFSLDEDDYNSGQLFDIRCTPANSCNQGADLVYTDKALMDDSEGGLFWGAEAGADKTGDHTANDVLYISGGELGTEAEILSGAQVICNGDLLVDDGGMFQILDENGDPGLTILGGVNCHAIDMMGDSGIYVSGGDLTLAAEDGITIASDVAITGDIRPDSDLTYALGGSGTSDLQAWYEMTSQLLYLVSPNKGKWFAAEVTNNGVFKLYYSTSKTGFVGKLSLNSSGQLKTTGTITQSTTLDS